ncbi:CaiB/BaiF CoA transferase family protein [Seohaeicola zhoushanensis]
MERDQGDFARGYDRLVHGESAYFVWLNRGKESVCLDLKSPDDMAILTEMLDRADVFIQNLAPGAADRLGLSPETLRGRNPRLITVTINGYGDTGPYAERKAYDLLVQAESGLSAITGNEAGTARVGVSVCDIATGMTAHQAVLQALFARQRSGQGRHISVSLFHALADWMNVPYLQYAYGGKVAERQGLRHPTIAPYGVFAAADGKEILLSIQNEREWVRLCEQVLDAPALATDPRFASNSDRVANRPELDGIVAETFAQFSRDEIFARLSAADIACGQVSSLADLAEHPQNRYVEADTPSGPVRLLGPGALVDGALPQYGPVPALGQHTDAVRAEFTPHRDEQAG